MKRLWVIGLVVALLSACGDIAEDSTVDSTGAPPVVEHDSGQEGGDIGQEDSGITEPSAESPEEESSSATEAPTSAEDRDRPEPTQLPEPVPVSTTVPPAVTRVPGELLANIKADLASRTSAAESAMTIVRAEEAIWNDGSLGCPAPGEMYTQALVDGFWVVFDVNGTSYDYRASATGFFKLCEGGGAPPTNPTG